MAERMTLRENALAIMRYEKYERMPVISFGFWNETVSKWADEGHITREEADDYIARGDNGDGDRAIMKKLGFDYNWNTAIWAHAWLEPGFETAVLEEREDGHRVIRDDSGLIVLVKPGVECISSQIGTSLTGRKAWEELYLPRLQFSVSRLDMKSVRACADTANRRIPLLLHCGSLMGLMRNLLGVEHLSYLYSDDPSLFKEIVDTIGVMSYEAVKAFLANGAIFDFVFFWEDICFKNGPLVSPEVFDRWVGPHYGRIADLLNSHGVDLIPVDCDGLIDSLIPTWIENGVNVMFPIEVGTWGGSIKPWREKYGRRLKGVGGMNKTVFAQDRHAVDAEIERLLALIDLGGYLPCPDHRIAPDAKFDNVRYYCHRLRNELDRL